VHITNRPPLLPITQPAHSVSSLFKLKLNEYQNS
jgi:hypothetical protein